MKRAEVPFNIKLLALPPERVRLMKPVTVLDIFEGSSNDFHPDGLFSVLIFGRVGDERRSRRFSYINVKVPLIHPIIFNVLTKMKRLYGEILAGTSYAKWDLTVHDFIKASALDGRTGFAFFLEYWDKIEFEDTQSTTRQQAIALIAKYKGVALTSNIVVMPAGLRDLEIDDHNRKSSDEINTMYRRLIALSNAITDATVRNSIELLNGPRYQMQLSFNQIYDYITSLIEGKKKLLLGRWASRNIFNGTRNVITAADTSVAYLGKTENADLNTTIIGLYQYMKAALPVTIFQIRQMMNSVFKDSNIPTYLINKKTLQLEEVLLDNRYFNQWATNEGVEKIITTFQEETIRNRPLEIDGRYLFLIYKGPDGTFKLMSDIRELPEGRRPSDVYPITFTELLYLAVYKDANKYPVFVTRYPIEGAGSIYPSHVHLRVTLDYERRTRLDENWAPMAEEWTAQEYPIIGSSFVNSLVPHSSKLAGLGAD